MPSNDFIVSAAGVRMPRLIYGTAWKKGATERLVRSAIGCGFRGVDTACQPKHYDEAGVGSGIAASLGPQLARGDLYVQTKFTPPSGQDPVGIPYDPDALPARQVEQSFQTSLRNLKTRYVDSLVLHSPVREPEVWQALERIHAAGGAKQLGISNCYDPRYLEALHASARVKPAVVQNRFHAETGYDREIRAFCRAHRIVYQSFWTLTANPHVLSHATVRSLAAAHGCTPAQILFRFLTQVDVVPLTGTRSEAHMREDLSIFEFELTPPELEAVDALL